MAEYRDQHFLPRLLIRRFASRHAGDQHYVWLFRRNAQPVEANVRGVGGSRDFYVSEDRASFEEGFSRLESRFSTLLTRLSGEGAKTLLAGDRTECAELVSHLVARSRDIRAGSAEAFESLNREAFRRAQTAPELPGMIAEKLRSLGLPSENSDVEEALATVPVLLAMLGGEDAILGQFNFGSLAREAQAEVLRREPSPGVRAGALAKESWRVAKFDDGCLVLGEVGAVAYEEGNWRPASLFTPAAGGILVLPIDPMTALLAGEEQLAKTPTVQAINAASARLSRDFFVSSQNREEERTLQLELGRDHNFWIEHVLREAGLTEN